MIRPVPSFDAAGLDIDIQSGPFPTLRCCPSDAAGLIWGEAGSSARHFEGFLRRQLVLREIRQAGIALHDGVQDLHRYEPYVSVIKLSTREIDRPDLVLKAYTSGSFDGNMLHLLDPDFSFLLKPLIFDNKAFPKEWSEGKIAGLCANDCTHCGKCTQVLNTVMKRDPGLPDFSKYQLAPQKPLNMPGR